MNDAKEALRDGRRAPYTKPEITTLSSERIIEQLGPATAIYGSFDDIIGGG